MLCLASSRSDSWITMNSPETTELRTKVGRGEYVVDASRVAEAIIRRRGEFVRDAHRSGVLVAEQLDRLASSVKQLGSGPHGDLA